MPSVVFVIVLASASIAVWLLIAYRLSTGSAPLPYRHRPHVVFETPAVLVTAMLYLIVPLILGSVVKLTSDRPLELMPFHVASSLIFLAVAVPVFLRFPQWLGGARLEPADIGIDDHGRMGQYRDGALAFLASHLPVWLVLMLLVELDVKTPDTMHDLLKLLMNDPGLWTVLWIVLAVVVVAPLVEEFLFRVVLQGWLQTRVSPTLAIVLVAELFCMVHKSPDSLALFPLAVILGYLYYRRYSFRAVVVTHALFNGANLLLFALGEIEKTP